MTGSTLDAAGRRTLLPEVGAVDGRTKPAQAFKQAVADIVADLGGADHLTRAEVELIRRCAGLGVVAAQIEGALLRGEGIDLEAYCTAINAQSRTLARLGLRRRPRDVTPPTLASYLAGKATPAAGAAE